MRKLTHLSLFSGIGGLDLAAEWAGFKTVGQCEWADYPTKVLEKHWPDIPRWRDIKTLTKESFYERTGLWTVDVISGGFPCQPFSVAGKQRGKGDDRYLWPEMVRVIKELRPTWVVGENVAGIVRMALPDILSELEACGYRARAFLVPACAVGARHRRYRVAIVGYAEHNGLPSTEVKGSAAETSRGQQERTETSGEFAGAGQSGNSKIVADAESIHEGRLSFGAEAEVTGFGSSSKDVANSKGKGNWGLPIQQGRTQQEDTDIKRGCENVQHSDCTGRQKQYSSCKPDQKGFPCRGCDEGTICHSTSKRLPDRPSGQMGRQGQEQEPERPDSDVSNADRGADLWREQCKKASGQNAESREYIGNGKEEHAERKRRTTQPGLGGMADGVPGGMDRDYMINHYWDTEPDIPRLAAGVQDRVGRLKALGNAVVPQQFYPIFRAIAEIEKRSEGVAVLK